MTILQNFILKNVERIPAGDGTEHWIWTQKPQHQGYGRPKVCGSRVYAHRLAWEAFKGEIPQGLTIDHKCRTRCCVNPDHLEPVTDEENNRRKDAARTHCLKGGHELVESNVRVNRNGHRICIACDHVRAARRRAKKEAANGQQE